MAVDTLGHQRRRSRRARKLAAAAQEATGESAELLYVDQDCPSEKASEAAKAEGAELCVGLRVLAQALGGGTAIRLRARCRRARVRMKTRRGGGEPSKIPTAASGGGRGRFCLYLEKFWRTIERGHISDGGEADQRFRSQAFDRN